MRRSITGILAPLVLVLGTAWLVATAPTASAHPGVENPYVEVGVPSTVVVGVPAEEPAALTGVDISLPATFTLLRLDQPAGWRATSGPGPVLHFREGDVPEGGYATFSFSGVFATRGVLAVEVTTHQADGSERRWDGGTGARYPAALVYPGHTAADVPARAAAGGTGSTLRTWGPRAAALAALVVLGSLAVARRRRATRRTRPPVGASG